MDDLEFRRLNKLLDAYIELKVPSHVRSSVRLSYRWERSCLTLREERPDYDLRIWYSQDIAQFRYEQGKWTVWSMNRDNEWSKVVSIQPESDFERQLELVELDQEGVFWVS